MLDNHGFNMWSGNYDKEVNITDDNGNYPFAGYKKIINSIYGTIMKTSPAKILDIGTGTGVLASRLYNKGIDITGIDFSDGMLNQARSKMPNAKLFLFDFSKGLPNELHAERFDFIISTYALHHLTDVEKVGFIQSLLGHINKTGSIMIGDVGFFNRDDLIKCSEACGDAWDEDEFYFIFSELNDMLSGS